MFAAARLSKNQLRCISNPTTSSGLQRFFTASAVRFAPEYHKPTASLTPDAHEYELSDLRSGDHLGRSSNHIWTKDEIDGRLAHLWRHKPVSVSDHIMNKLMVVMYHGFNFITGYRHKNPTVASIEWRLIALESVAGVPGFIAAGSRHFYSLRNLERDHGWIATLLEEAENERMHLLVCMKMFKASFFTRVFVISLQCVLTPYLMILYSIHPQSVHRFVGYLEETACHTYASIIEHVETPGTHLHESWSTLPAPEAAIAYWRLPKHALFIDTLKCMFADEANHRDVNHTFAEMKSTDPNPFVGELRENARKAWILDEKKESAW